jgi:hypothetical protein
MSGATEGRAGYVSYGPVAGICSEENHAQAVLPAGMNCALGSPKRHVPGTTRKRMKWLQCRIVMEVFRYRLPHEDGKSIKGYPVKILDVKLSKFPKCANFAG